MTPSKTKAQKTANTVKRAAERSMSFALKSVKDVEFGFFNIGGKHLDLKKVHMGVNWKANVSKTDGSVMIFIMVYFNHSGASALKHEFYPFHEKWNDTIIHYTTKSTYHIGNFDQVVTNIRKGNFEISPDFFKSLLSISISTTRGMLISRLANTEYSGIIIPPFSSQRLNELYESALSAESPARKKHK